VQVEAKVAAAVVQVEAKVAAVEAEELAEASNKEEARLKEQEAEYVAVLVSPREFLAGAYVQRVYAWRCSRPAHAMRAHSCPRVCGGPCALTKCAHVPCVFKGRLPCLPALCTPTLTLLHCTKLLALVRSGQCQKNVSY